MSKEILKVSHLGLDIRRGKKTSAILKDVSFTLHKKQRLGVVGNSGAGKSMTLYALANLLPEKTTQYTGSIVYHGEQDILQMDSRRKRRFCSENTAVILQDSMNALNPYRKINRQLEENICHFHQIDKDEARQRINEMLKLVGIQTDEATLDKYPGQLSGGMRQRITIAMALESNAGILIADEPTTALDVINQMNFVRLLDRICEERELALIFISHNLGLVSMLCDDVLVMEEGRIVERGAAEKVFSQPEDACTKALVAGTRRLLDNNYRVGAMHE